MLIVTLTIHQMQPNGTPEPMRFHSNQCMCIHQLRHSLGPRKHEHDFYFCQMAEQNTAQCKQDQKSGAKRNHLVNVQNKKNIMFTVDQFQLCRRELHFQDLFV